VMDLHLGQPPKQREPGRVLRPGGAADRRIPGGGRQAGRLAGEGRRGLPQVRSQLRGRTARACLDRRLPRVPARVLGRLDAGAAQISRLRSPSALRARCVRTCPRLQLGSSEASRAWPSVSAAAVAARRAVAVWIRWPRLPGSLSIISARPTSRAVPALYCSSFTAILAHGRSRARSPSGNAAGSHDVAVRVAALPAKAGRVMSGTWRGARRSTSFVRPPGYDDDAPSKPQWTAVKTGELSTKWQTVSSSAVPASIT
jgi:hypothetical protein